MATFGSDYRNVTGTSLIPIMPSGKLKVKPRNTERPLKPVTLVTKVPLRVNAPLADRICHTIDRKHVGRDAIVNVVRFGVTNNVIE